MADSGQRPLSALPSPLARAVGFAAILIGGIAGGVIGWAFVAIQSDTALWKALGMMNQGCVLALTGEASNAVQMITSGITAFRSTSRT